MHAGSRRAISSLTAAVLVLVLVPGAATAATPKVTISSAPATFARSTTATVRWTKSPSTLAVSCRIDSRAFATCSGTSKTFRSLAQGKHTFQLKYKRGSKFVTVSRSWTVDTVKPANGFIITNPLFVSDANGLDVSIDPGSDARSGISTWQVQVRKATLSAGTCGAFGALTNVGAAKPASPIVVLTPPDPSCLRYQLVVKDKAGNTATYPAPSEARVDTTTPTGTFNDLPSVPAGVAFGASGTASDQQSGISEVNVRSLRTTAFGQEGGSLCTATPVGSAWSCTVNKGNIEDGIWTIQAVIKNAVLGETTLEQNGIAIRNNAPGIDLFDPTLGGTKVIEASLTDALEVALDTVPVANVTVNVTGNGDLTPSPAALTFTSANWDKPQVVTLTAVDDAAVEAQETVSVGFASTSTDLAFNGLAAAKDVTVIDNDSPTVFNTDPSILSVVRESGVVQERRDFSLGKIPTGTVTLSFASNKTGLAFSPSTLTFTPANARTPQRVTISAVDDLIFEPGDVVHTVSVTAASPDAAYNGIAIPTFTVTEQFDNDFPGLLITPSAFSTDVTEGGAADTVKIRLKSVPTANVVVNLTKAAEPDDFTRRARSR